MTPEELLKPRYLVVASYPHMEQDQIGVGDIISPYGMGFMFPKSVEAMYEAHPHLFRRLEWHEYREEKDMPEYVKGRDGVYKANFDHDSTSTYWMFLNERGIHPFNPSDFQPATLEEYTQYINQSTKGEVR